jgi:hypothetical protein
MEMCLVLNIHFFVCRSVKTNKTTLCHLDGFDDENTRCTLLAQLTDIVDSSQTNVEDELKLPLSNDDVEGLFL